MENYGEGGSAGRRMGRDGGLTRGDEVLTKRDAGRTTRDVVLTKREVVLLAPSLKEASTAILAHAA